MTNKPIPAHCDSGCGKNFTITKFRTRKVKNGIEKTYFRCTHCKQEYVAYYASPETIQLQKEMRKLTGSLRSKEGTPEGTVLLQHISELKAKIKRSMAEARMVAES